MSIYFDNAATTQIDSDVYEAMEPFLKEAFYNPSSLYTDGRILREKLQESRSKVAKAIHGEREEITFTSGGTESNNMAIKGVAWQYAHKGRHLITTEVEHHAVLNTFKWLETRGFKVTYLPVNPKGVLEPHVLEAAITEETILISVMWVNNEVGAINPLKELIQIAHKKAILFHTDAVQAMKTEAIDVGAMGIDLMSFSSHKIYGPKGIGGLYCKKSVKLVPLIHGGGQEGGKRAGTEATALIIGFGVAIEKLTKEKAQGYKQMAELKTRFLKNLEAMDQWCVNGHREGSPAILNIGIADVEAEAVLLLLNRSGVAASMGAACNTMTVEPSYVLEAMAVKEQYIGGCIRFSFGKFNTIEEVDEVTDIVKQVLSKLRA